MNFSSMKKSAVEPWFFDAPAAMTEIQFDAAWRYLLGDKQDGDFSRVAWRAAAKRAKAQFPGIPKTIRRAA